MNRHVYFWLGVFVAIIIGMPFLLVYSDALPAAASQVFALAVGFVFGLCLLLVVILFFRDRLLRLLTGGAEEKIDTVINHAFEAITKANDKDYEGAQSSAETAVKPLLSWLLWLRFYKWVISASIALLVLAGTFAGTVLLSDQNKKFDVQNSLASLSVSAEIRQVIVEGISDSDLRGLPNDFTIYTSSYLYGATIDESGYAPPCRIRSNADVLLSLAGRLNESSVLSISNLAVGDVVSDRVIEALQHLTHDSDSAVALGAMMVLARIGVEPTKQNLEIKNMHLQDFRLNARIALRITDSVIENFVCPNCTSVVANNSIVTHAKGKETILNSLVFSDDYSPVFSDDAFEDIINNSVILHRSLSSPSDSPVFPNDIQNSNLLISANFRSAGRVVVGAHPRLFREGETQHDSDSDFSCDLFCHSSDLFSCDTVLTQVTPEILASQD